MFTPFLHHFCKRACFKLPYRFRHRFIRHMNIPIHCRFYTRVTKQSLQHLWLHTAFNRSCGVCMAKCVHTESLNFRFIAKLIQMGIIGTVFRWLPCSPVNKNKIAHNQIYVLSGTPVNIFECLRKRFRLLPFTPSGCNPFENLIGAVCQRNRAVTLLCFRRSSTPISLLMRDTRSRN